jgi:hypothetical protein
MVPTLHKRVDRLPRRAATGDMIFAGCRLEHHPAYFSYRPLVGMGYSMTEAHRVRRAIRLAANAGHANRCATSAPFDEVMVEYKPILKYRAAEVIAAAGACNVARSLMNVRLLSAEVPLVPLKTCDRPATCKCIYRHFDDRRRKFPRREEHALNALMACTRGVERRTRRGRRESDYA